MKKSEKKRLLGRVNKETITINTVKCICLLDTGSAISAVSEKFYHFRLSHIPLKSLNSLFDKIDITSATGRSLNIKDFIEVDVLFPGLNFTSPILMCVLCDSILSNDMPALIGSNALESWKQELNQHYSTPVKINPVIDAWSTKDQAANIGVLRINETHKPSRNQVCTFIKCTLKVHEPKLYDCKVHLL